MLEKDIQIFKKVIELAKKNRLTYEKDIDKKSIITLDSIEQIFTSSDTEKELQQFLKTLDLEIVSNICSIMYLGRDRDYIKSDSPEEILRKHREYFDENMEYDKKNMINTIMEKIPFDEYLGSGLEILGVHI